MELVERLMTGLAPWIEVDGVPRRATAEEFAGWFRRADPRIAEDRLGVVRVVTYFVGLPPLYETLVDDRDCPDRYGSREEACQGHAAAARALARRLLARRSR